MVILHTGSPDRSYVGDSCPCHRLSADSPECPPSWLRLLRRVVAIFSVRPPHPGSIPVANISGSRPLSEARSNLSPAAPTRDFTATTFIVRNEELFLLWHNKIETWLPPGGHIHDHELPHVAALREVKEESGLNVRLILAGDDGQKWGPVEVLHQPVCILLEDIEPGHQHIDLIYFAVCLDDEPACVNQREAREGRLITASVLASAQDIHEDIRILGLRALEAARS